METGIKAVSFSTTMKCIIEDMSNKGRFCRNKKEKSYWWVDLSLTGSNDSRLHPGLEEPYALDANDRWSDMSVFLARNYGLKHGSRKNFAIIKMLVSEAKCDGKDYSDFKELLLPNYVYWDVSYTAINEFHDNEPNSCDMCGAILHFEDSKGCDCNWKD